ncbi:hypothetical protein J4212_08290 [Candidatus Woesearchaeota archaeon]|nr:hypothetical protein [Candidatus Woesearchaeota archaeon]
MQEQVKNDILAVLSIVLKLLEVKEESDAVEMRQLSNHTIHNASVFQDEFSVSVAILVYSMSKIIERDQQAFDYEKISRVLSAAKGSLERNDDDAYAKAIKNAFDYISKVDSKLKLYIQEVISQAQIKKGSKLYEHGISMARSAEILGISQWELMSYVGKTSISEDMPEIIDMKSRLEFARGLFR